MMRLNRLGLKLFVAFVVVQMIVGVLVFSVFRSSQELEPSYQHMAKNLTVIKLILEETGRENVERNLNALARTGPTMVWVTGADGKIIARSFPGEVPEEARNLDGYRTWELGEATLYQVRRGDTEAVAAMPLSLSGEPATVYLSNRLRERVTPERRFLRGLAPVLIAGVIMVFLLTAFISRPLRRLHDAVAAMAAGDLGSRVKISSHDELGDLGRAFNRMADSLERLVRGNRELMSNVSHQLRTPLTRMGLSLELINDELERQRDAAPLPAADEDGKIRRHLGLLHAEIERMNELIGRILLLSRLDVSEAPTRQLSPCRPDRLLAEIAASFTPVLAARELSLTTEIAELPTAKLDADSLTIALENILDNAVKYAPPGGQVSICAAAAEKATLSIRICNTARQLSEQELAAILKPFARGPEAGAAGSGLGLPISQKIIAAQGGALSLSYENGRFCVSIGLPLRD